jgi:hypothetical protein
MLAASALPRYVLREDYYDLLDFLEYAGRTIARTDWAVDARRAADEHQLEGLF